MDNTALARAMWLRAIRVGLLAVLGVFALATLTGTIGSIRAGVVSNALLIALPLAAAACCAWRAVSESGRRRHSWGFIGAAALSWGLGQSIWTYYEQVLHREVPFPSTADIGYLGFIPLVLIGLVLMPYAELTLATRMRMLLDGLVIGVAILLVSWELILQPTLNGATDGPLAEAISFAYPVGDSVAITLALVIVARARHGTEVRMMTILTLAAGIMAFGVGDTGFLVQTQNGTYASGNTIDLGWAAGFTLIAIAATIGGSTGNGTPSRHTQRLSLLAPYGAVVVGLVVIGVRLAIGTSPNLVRSALLVG